MYQGIYFLNSSIGVLAMIKCFSPKGKLIQHNLTSTAAIGYVLYRSGHTRRRWEDSGDTTWRPQLAGHTDLFFLVKEQFGRIEGFIVWKHVVAKGGFLPNRYLGRILCSRFVLHFGRVWFPGKLEWVINSSSSDGGASRLRTRLSAVATISSGQHLPCQWHCRPHHDVRGISNIKN